MSQLGHALDSFHPLIRQWFLEETGQPTDIQERSWPEISTGRHVLITAPTGSGKTLTAFLWALNQLITGTWEGGATRVLYISPLKALNNDIRRNLLTPLSQLKAVFDQAGEPIPDIHVATRSGDTSQSDRRKMLRHPPEILITTPESLNLLLSSPNGQTILTALRSVILDEIHSVVDSKRGTHLITAVDRLVPLSGEFQRIALSATVKPMDVVAEFVGGLTVSGGSDAPAYTPRQVMTLQSAASKRLDMRIFSPASGKTLDENDSFWDDLVPEFKKIIKANRATLVFVNSRKLCEHITYRINDGEVSPLAYSHHGSLSREIREEVEAKLKQGELKAIVATATLEMGIDIGVLDEVLLIQCPSSIASTIQRIGRAGHQVGAVSKACLFPTHAFDTVQAAVLAREIPAPDIEETRPIQAPLDMLAQIIISMVGTETWHIDDLYTTLKTSYPYRNLSRKHFDLVLEMLAGRYADSLVRELKPRVSIDRLDHTVSARKGALLALYMSGGSIPDRGYYNIRHADNSARIGELDEEFVWEANIGKVFSIGNQHWRIERITHNDIFVRQASPRMMDIPFWLSEEFNRGFHLSDKMSRFLEEANDRLGEDRFIEKLRGEYQMNQSSVEYLFHFLSRQKDQTRADLPHRHHLLLEYINAGPGASPGNQIVLHTFWGGQVNRPYAMALETAWEEKYRHKLELFPSNDCIVLMLPHRAAPEEILSLITSENLEKLLRKRLEASGFFGGRFRECAGRSLLISRNKVHERMPLWMTRLKSQKLMESVREYEDFPILLETWRTCLQDEFDLEKLRLVLDELSSGEIRWSVSDTDFPSPFAQGVAWNQINKFMYLEDQALSGGDQSNLREDLIKELARSSEFKPEIPEDVAREFVRKRQRLAPGYAPDSPRELIDWVKDRVLIPTSEWRDLMSAIDRDSELGVDAIIGEVAEKLVRLIFDSEVEPLICALEQVSTIAQSLYSKVEALEVVTLSEKVIEIDGEPASDEDIKNKVMNLLSQWLQFYGPIEKSTVLGLLGIPQPVLDDALNDLIETKTIVSGMLRVDGSPDDICDAENLESLLRLKRRAAIPVFDPLEADQLTPYLAWYQGLTKKATSVDELFSPMEQLLCYPAPAELWESDILPARCQHYQTGWLDDLMRETELRWIGVGKPKIVFCYDGDRELLEEIDDDPENQVNEKDQNTTVDIIPDDVGRYSFSSLLSHSGLSPSKLTSELWRLVWAGLISNDTFASLRKGLENKFKQPEVAESPTMPDSRRRSHRQSRRSAFNRWKGSITLAGNWFRLSPLEINDDLMEREERIKDRARILHDRYGILFRELIMRELTDFTWSKIFRALRLMELSGEILSGYFFQGIPGPQFMSHQAFRMIQTGIPGESVYWMNATDPASLCGIQVSDLKTGLPKRLATTHLVYRGDQLVLISQKNGKTLEFFIAPDDDQLVEVIAPLKHLLYRQFKPLKSITIETINGESATQSPYAGVFQTAFEVLRERKNIVLYRKI